MTPTASRIRAWLWYTLAWIPLALFYALVVRQSQTIPASRAIVESLWNMAPVAILGVGVWWITGVMTWPPRNVGLFVTLHLVMMAAFNALWLSAEVLMIAAGTGLSSAVAITKTFAVFQAFDGILVYGVVAAGSYVLRVATRLRAEEARAVRADALRMRAELAALRGQLNPHFLFNTLHTLTALVRRDPATAERALERFGDMLRYVLDTKRRGPDSSGEEVTLGDELGFVRDYLSLEQLRLGDRLRVVEHIDADALDCALPTLTLQPLVENAIKYGIAPRAGGGRVEVSAALKGEQLVLDVRDDGPGAPANIADSAAGVGLRAVHQRLDALYGSADGSAERFVVTTAPGAGFAVRISVPARTLSRRAAAGSVA